MIGLLRYILMEKPNPSYLSSRTRLAVPRTVQAPQRHEGIGNALRAAFDPRSYGLPEDMVQLLAELDGVKNR